LGGLARCPAGLHTPSKRRWSPAKAPKPSAPISETDKLYVPRPRTFALLFWAGKRRALASPRDRLYCCARVTPINVGGKRRCQRLTAKLAEGGEVLRVPP
jgi:hypothetical protein